MGELDGQEGGIMSAGTVVCVVCGTPLGSILDRNDPGSFRWWLSPLPRGVVDVDPDRVVVHVLRERVHYGAIIKETRLPIGERKSCNLKVLGKPPIRELRYKVAS